VSLTLALAHIGHFSALQTEATWEPCRVSHGEVETKSEGTGTK
jgi:hypothetical protein